MDEYTRRAHSVCKLCYHAVFVIIYRRKVMDEEILAYKIGRASCRERV